MLVVVAGDAVVARHGAGIAVRGGAVVLGVEALTRTQNGILGLSGSVTGGVGCSGIVGASGTGRVAAAAGRSALVLAPCGLGLIPISCMFRLRSLSKRS